MNDAYSMALGKILNKRPMDDDQDDFELDMDDNDMDDDMGGSLASATSGSSPVAIPDWMKRKGLYDFGKS
jgi:hypothetical protein